MKTYEFILADIQNKIESHFYKPGEQLPSLREFAKIYHTTPVTMKKSLSILEEKGFVYVIDRKGFFVTETNKKFFTMNFNEFKCIDRLSNTKIIEVKEIDHNFLAQNYQIVLSQRSRCLKITRVLMDKMMPVGIDIRYITHHAKKNFNKNKLSYLLESLSLVLNNYDMNKELTISVMTDNTPVKDVLFIGSNEPVFMFKQIYRTHKGQFACLSETFVPCEEVQLKMYG